MSIVNDFAAINRAMQARQSSEPVRPTPSHNGRPICHKCYSDLGNPPAPVVMACKNCGEVNHVYC